MCQSERLIFLFKNCPQLKKKENLCSNDCSLFPIFAVTYTVCPFNASISLQTLLMQHIQPGLQASVEKVCDNVAGSKAADP